MAIRKQQIKLLVNEVDSLIISKESFTTKLLERISIGEDLCNRQINTIEELDKNEKDFYKWDSYNSEFLKIAFNNEENQYRKTYDVVNFSYDLGGSYSQAERLKELRKDIQNKIDNLDGLIEKVDLIKSKVETPQIMPIATNDVKEDKTNIFIVHGHNAAIQQSVARTIEKIGLVPIILHEQPNVGKTVIEKFESHTNVGFAIILLTDDDEGKSKMESELKKRARQNVVLELGYFIGKLNRSRVLPLYIEGVELPSDINGLLYIPIDKAENWKFAIVKELKAAGYSVDANKLL